MTKTLIKGSLIALTIVMFGMLVGIMFYDYYHDIHVHHNTQGVCPVCHLNMK